MGTSLRFATPWAAMLLAACTMRPESPQAPAPVAFKPIANVDQLMDAVITPAAEIYWDSVSIIVDDEGVTEHFPETDEEWEAVWSAAVTLAEAGNLLMIAPRAVDDGEWMQMSLALVDVGVEAIDAAEARDPERVLDAGERVYNVCLQCHARYIVGGDE